MSQEIASQAPKSRSIVERLVRHPAAIIALSGMVSAACQRNHNNTQKIEPTAPDASAPTAPLPEQPTRMRPQPIPMYTVSYTGVSPREKNNRLRTEIEIPRSELCTPDKAIPQNYKAVKVTLDPETGLPDDQFKINLGESFDLSPTKMIDPNILSGRNYPVGAEGIPANIAATHTLKVSFVTNTAETGYECTLTEEQRDRNKIMYTTDLTQYRNGLIFSDTNVAEPRDPRNAGWILSVQRPVENVIQDSCQVKRPGAEKFVPVDCKRAYEGKF
ncbi:hypothetical protein KBD59_05500 [Candidatus Gracilibacteria bacterium]|nr:hypothetical protein [Candidatus Gracilibacteria bacterium]